ncbi:hypothetical protein IU510_29725 [Nocardia cyriacigeorgica]|uniref:hypothetical protein n=1 Tax=Nocardia cyriacigeorgica TaxID=135487 RepID=UPI00189452B9|nr:hypothetical protein [Nocardia cyriacigeorgica]MBF6102200.1 hypothetical protein [Nocardia cyriacigeorgica]MBF6347361.1 hypothetical protein [Nocardia cyriacigeorgica]
MTAAGKAATAWAGLNPRQRLYLSTILDFDQAAEADIKQRSANWETIPPAAEWRQILYDIKLPKSVVGYSSVQSRLREAGQHDSGSGSTLAALERRKLVAVTHDMVYIPQLGTMVPRIRVRLSTLGRATARHGGGVAAPMSTPRGLLSRWSFNALAMLYAAGEDGLVLYAKGTPSWNTLVRLRNRPYDPWIEEFSTRTGEYRFKQERVRATPNARRHFEIHAACYRELYPDIDAPEPTQAAHVVHGGLADHRLRTPKHLLVEADVAILSELVRVTGTGTCWLQQMLLREYRDRPVPESIRTMRPGLLRNQVKDRARTDAPIQRLSSWPTGALAEMIELTDPAITQRWPGSMLILTEHGGEHFARHHEQYRQLYPDLHLAPSPAGADRDG